MCVETRKNQQYDYFCHFSPRIYIAYAARIDNDFSFDRCADGYMGQRCEFKDLDGSYLPARERVLLETASIAGGATVACVFVFVILFAMYVIMQKDKDKRCRLVFFLIRSFFEL